MSGCHLCNGTGYIVTCEEPMAGLAGYSSELCACADNCSKVSTLEAAWAARDAAEVIYDLRKAEAALVQKAETSQWAEVVRLDRAARAVGPRPAKVPT